MKLTGFLFLMAGVAAALVGCGKQDNHRQDEIRFSYITAERSFCLVGSATDFEQDNDLSFGARSEIVMPEILLGRDARSLRDSILVAAFGRCEGKTDTLIANAMLDYAKSLDYAVADTVLPDSVVSSNPNFLSRYDGSFSAEGDIETLTGHIVSYAVTVSSYIPGAAHGMYNINYVNYDLDSARVITLEDLFIPEGIEALPKILRDTAASMVRTIGKTEIESLPAGGNFYLTAGNEVVFAYQPYEVASYAQGEIQIPIPAYLLSNYLTDYGNRLLLQ